jgi:hypothetical protein
MRTADVIAHFGSPSAVARALSIKPPSVYGWGETVPPLRQVQIETITGGKLKADPGILRAVPQQQTAWDGSERRGQMR